MYRTGVELNSPSLAAHYLRMVPYGSTQEMAVGTGFFYEFDNYLYLITNGHNVTRVNPETNERITNSMAFPVKIEFKVRQLITEPQIAMDAQMAFVDLYEDEEFKKPIWYVHPTYNYKVDVIVIPVCAISEVPVHIRIYPINRFDFEDRFLLDVSDEVFILGFPFALTGGKELPIWKRGSVATEPGIDLDGLPKLLVDTATRQGMSGAPVIFKRTGIHGYEKYKPSSEAIFGTIEGFVGIYSGRIGGKDELQAQLGVVWKKTVIDEILSAKVKSDISFQKI